MRHAQAVATIHKVSVIHIISDDTVTEDYIDFNTENNLNIYIGYVRKTKNPILKIRRFWKLYNQILKKVDAFDVVHLNEIFPFGIFALQLKNKFRKPYIISEHWTGYLASQKSGVSFFEKFISKKIVKNADFVCPVSELLQQHMLNFGLKGNYNIVPNVVDTNLFIPKNTTNNSFTLIHVSGMNNAQKNISGMLEVAKKLEDKIGTFTWNFIGGSDVEFSNLIEKLNFKKATINFIHHISQKQLASYLQEANICVSFSNYETFGLVMAESIACGTAVISTNTGFLAQAKTEEFFKIIQIKNEEKLLQEILNIHENKRQVNKEKMHEYITEKYSVSIIAKTFSSLYDKILKN